ncbi:dipeptidase [Pseudonocardia sulfidoxydans NBRC 16205]|uniref:Dipeptidase n=1 Tax=Pseudonocardia sulfidoxydans NBRC 16205 TaxID=1223511 RepID=A0A511DFY5_9PSEU|nr:amidohydrolase family protein [Pseudonocardia sulfidoxydans]GEL23690.1 dipeptidase [Pseudonocardia sulfidoxydans NBRC 16205]
MASSWLLIAHGTVVDGAGNPPVPNASVLVRDGLIHAVGTDVTRELVPRGETLREIDATGRTVMPGLIDAHCHMTYGESRSEEEIDLYTSPESRTLKAAFHAQKVLRSGVTGISQPGGSYYIGVALRDAVRDGIVQGPRMTSAGRYLSTSNGLTDWYPDSVGVPEGSIGIVHNRLDDMIDEVRHQVKNGVDLIKLADSPYGDFQAFTTHEMTVLADLAHQLGKKITIHARGSAEVDAAVTAGMDWIMHGNILSDETVAHLAESGTPLVPTLLLLANAGDWGHLVGAPAPLRDGMKRMLEKSADALHRAHAAGVPMVLGTDSGFSLSPYGVWHARELDLLMRYAGLTSLEAIKAGTSNGALMLGLEGLIGTVAPGMIADLIVVNGDPVADITVLQRREAIETVVQDGRVVEFDEDAIARSWPHDRGIGYSVTDLTYDVVHGLGNGADPRDLTAPEGVRFDDEHAADLVSDLRRRERSAGTF